MAVKVELNNKIRQCEHCGAKNIKRSYYIYRVPDGAHFQQTAGSNPENQLYIGRICLERETGISTSGNPHNAIKRLQMYLDNLDDEGTEYIWSLRE